MNKEKVIQMIEDYGSKQYEAGTNYGPASDMDADDLAGVLDSFRKEAK